MPTAPLAFTGITPCRVADTRGNGFSGQYGPPQLTPAGRTITIINTCGIPAAAQAVSFNFSAVNVPGAGFLVAYPAGGAFPPVATMTYNQNTPNLSNAAVVPLGTAGAITVVAAVVSIDLVIDVNGYYAPQTVVNTVNALSGAVTLAAGSNVTITPSGNTLTVASTGGGAGWSLTGNAGTNPATNFLGTTDNQALEIRVKNLRAFRLEPGSVIANVIGGSFSNVVTAGVSGATIGGGGGNPSFNTVTDDFGVVGGGNGNRAGNAGGAINDAVRATVGGGFFNVAGGTASTVAGGDNNTASGSGGAIGGGSGNTAGGGNTAIAGGFTNTTSGTYAAVAGGANNVASGFASMVAGGSANRAAVGYSLAAGRRAKADHQGTYVWGDSTDLDVASTGTNQFIVRAAGGIWLGTTSTPSFAIATDFLRTSTGAHLTIGGIWTNNSDRASKKDFEAIDGREVLSRVAALPISRWRYKAEEGSVRHIGPMAQDFSAAFGLGSDDRSITTLDADGVALAAIQALYKIVREKDSAIRALKTEMLELRSRLDAVEAQRAND